MSDISDAELISYMDEALPPTEMVRVEKALRRDAELKKRYDRVRQGRDRGWHSVGAMWRAHALSCPSRSQLGSYLLDALDPGWQDYIQFHLQVVGCRVCVANLEDLQSRTQSEPETAHRRRKFFQSSVGRLQSG